MEVKSLDINSLCRFYTQLPPLQSSHQGLPHTRSRAVIILS